MLGNQIALDRSIAPEISDIIKDLLSFIEHQVKNETLCPDDDYDIVLFLSELLPYIENQKPWIDFGCKVCQKLKAELEKDGINSWTAMFRGLGAKCFAINAFCRQANILTGFCDSLNHLLFMATKLRLEQLKGKENLDQNFDLISGIAGTLYYLLDCDATQEEETVLQSCVQYLLALSKDTAYSGQTVIGFHIQMANQKTLLDPEEFKNGLLNFGLAHGMLGPLIALSKAYAKGLRVDGLQEGVEKLYHLYETFQIVQANQIPLWPSMLPLESYVAGTCKPKHLHLQASWCYGNVGVIRGLQKVCGYMHWEKAEASYTELLLRFFAEDSSTYALEKVSLCHGFASLLVIQTCAYHAYQNPKFLRHLERNIRMVIAGYRESNAHKVSLLSIRDGTNHIEGYLEDFSLLTGSIGIAITLLSLGGTIKTGKLLMID